MLTKKDLIKMMGEEDSYYLENLSKKYSFNWGAAFIPYLWMPYRNLYFLSIIIEMSIYILRKLFIKGDIAIWIFFISYRIVLGFLGNRLYFRFLEDMHKRGYSNLKGNPRAVLVILIFPIFIVASILMINIIYSKTYSPQLSWLQITIDYLSYIKSLKPSLLGLFSGVLIVWLIDLLGLYIFGGERRKEVFFWPLFRK